MTILEVYSQRGNDSFPTREYYVPNVGTKIGIKPNYYKKQAEEDYDISILCIFA
jgi:hypothetical protein